MKPTTCLAALALAVAPALAYGAPAVFIARKPSLVSPRTELGDAALQARYTTMWERYSADVDDATRTLREEIERQTKSATGSGNLDLTLFWKALGKEFEQRGELQWHEPSLKKSWNTRFGDASFPTEFGVAVKKASAAYKSAQQVLEKGYGELVAEFTKAEKLEEALKVRAELKELLAERASAPESAPAAKPEPKPAAATVDLLQGIDLRANKGWRRNGNLLIGGSEKLVIPVSVKGDYDLVVEFSLTNSLDGGPVVGLGMNLPAVRGMPKVFFVTKPDAASLMAGYIPGADLKGEKPTAITKSVPTPILQQRPYTALVRVRGGGSSIAVLLGGQEILTFPDSPHLATANTFTVERWAGGSEITLRKASITEIPK